MALRAAARRRVCARSSAFASRPARGTSRPERQRHAERDGDRVPAVVGQRQEGRVVARPTLVTPTLAVKPGRASFFASSTARSPPSMSALARPQLVAMPVAEAVELVAVHGNGGPHQRRHRRHRRLRGPVEQGVESRRESRALPPEQVPAVDDAGYLRLQPDHGLLQPLAGGVAGAGQGLVVLEQRLLLAGEAERGVDVRQVVVALLDLGDDVPAGLPWYRCRRAVASSSATRSRSSRVPNQGNDWVRVTLLSWGPTRVSTLRRAWVKLTTGSGSAATWGDRSRAASYRARDSRNRRIALDRRRHVGAQIRRDGVEVERVIR